jgi:hypothetical protein
MILVELDRLKDQAKSLAEFLREGLEAQVRIKGSEIQVEVARSKDVKLALHKFLHHTGLNDYRIILHQKTLTILPPKKPSKRADTSPLNLGEGVSPFSPYRMNPLSSVEFPNYPAVPPRKYKQPKKK